MKTRPNTLWLWLLLCVVGAGGCCSSKGKVWERLKAGRDPGLARDAELSRDVNALNHFSRAQQFAHAGQGDAAVEEMKAALKADPGSAFLRESLSGLLFQMQKPDQARRYAEEAISISPDRASSHDLLGQILLSQGKFLDAEESFSRAYELEPDNSGYLADLVQALDQGGKPERALTLLTEYAGRHPGNPDTYFLMGIIYQRQERIDQALASYYHVIKLDRSHYPALKSALEIELARNNLPASAALARQVVDYYPGDSETRLILADLLLALDQREEALAVLEAGKTSGEAKPEWWVRKGYLYLFSGKVDEAKAEFEGALAADPASAEAVFGLGQVALRRDDLVEAASYFEAVPADSESYAAARRQLAVIALRNGSPEQAVAIMEKLHRERSDDPEVVVSYSAVLRDVERYDEAERLVTAALKKAPEDEGLQYELAMLYYVQGRAEDGIAIVQKMLDQDPENAQALNFIGYTYAEMGVKLDEAEAMITKALELSPHAGFIMDSLGWLKYQRGDYQGALELLLKAAELEGEDAEIMEHVGDCYRAMKQKPKAVESYQKALKTCTSMKVRRRIEQKLGELR